METDSKQDTVPQEDLQEKYTEELEEERKLKKWDLVNKQWAATAIFSGVVLLLVAFLFIRHEIFTGFLSYVLGVLRPITIGLVIAFVLYRPTCQIEKLLQKAQKKFPRFPAGVIAVFCSYFLMLLLLGGVIWIIVPQFADSIRDFSDNILIYYSNVMKFLNSDRGEQIFRFLPRLAAHQADQPHQLHSRCAGHAGHIGKRSDRRFHRLFHRSDLLRLCPCRQE